MQTFPVEKGLERMLWHDKQILTATWRADGLQCASGGYAPLIYVWDTAPDATSRKPMLELSLPSGKTFNLRGIAWSPDSTRILAWDDLTGFHIWDAATGAHLLSSTPSGVFTASWSADGARVIATSQNAVRVHDASSGKATRTIRGAGIYLISGVWNRDETRILAGSYGDPLTIHTTKKGGTPLAMAESKGVIRARWSLDEKRILYVQSETQRATVWNAANGEPLQFLHPDAGMDAAWSANESRVILYRRTTSPQMTLCDGASGEVVFEEELTHTINGVEWSADGNRFVVHGPRVQIRAGSDAALVAVIDDFSRFRTARWSPDGRRLVIGGDRRCLTLWDLDKLGVA